MVLAGVALAASVAACGFAGETVPPASPDAGIQATGRIDGSPVAISRGAPIVIIGDCDPEDGPDEDLCILARTLDGLEVDLVVENRDALVAGEIATVGRASCVDGCDARSDVVIARVEVGDDVKEVTSGTFEVSAAGDRYTADFDLTMPSGDRLSGTFDVAERLPVENPSGVLRSAPED